MAVRDLLFSIKAKDETASAFGQVRDNLRGVDGMLAGVGDRARRVQSGLMSLAGAATAVTGGMVLAFRDSLTLFDVQERAQTKVAQAITQTGAAAGFAADELFREASALQSITRFGDEAILDGVTAQLLTFTNIAGDSFTRAQVAALDLATVLDADLKGTAIMLGKALNDPIAGIGALGEAGITFTQEQKDVVRSLVETGQAAQAQAVILDEIARVYGGQAAAAAATGIGPIIQLQNAWGDLKEVVGGVIADLLPPVVSFFQGLVDGFASMDPPAQRAIVVLGLFAAAIGPVIFALAGLKAAILALSGPLGWVLGAVGLVAAAYVTMAGNSVDLEARTDDLVASVSDEIRATGALSTALGNGITYSASTASQKLVEAKARHENVKAIIAEHRALVQSSSEYQDAMEALKRGGLNQNGPGPTGYIDPELYRIGAIGRRVDGESHQAMETISRLGTPPELLRQLSETESNIARLEAMGGTAGGALPGVPELGDVLDNLGQPAARAAGAVAGVGKAADASADQVDDLLAGLEESKGVFDDFGRETSDMLKSVFANGKLSFESFGDFVLEWGGRFLDRVLSQVFDPMGDAFQGLLDGLFTSGGGGGGGIGIGGLGGALSGVAAGVGNFFSGMLGFDTGGEMEVTGRAGIDRNVAAFRVSADENIKVVKRGQPDGGRPVNVYIQTPDPGAFHASRGRIAADISRAVGHGARFT